MTSVMDFHEVASIFPMMSAEEFNALKSDIAANGQREPVWTYRGKVIDGRNRYRACVELGIEPVCREWNGVGSLVAFVVSLNLHRRHLDSSQRAAVAVEILPRLEAEANERQRGGRGGVLLSQKIDEAKSRASDQAARIVGTNRQYVSDAKKLKQEEPELFERVRSGEITIPEAKKEVRIAERAKRDAELESPSLPTGRYGLVYVDPPWQYDFSKSDSREIENHYPTMDLEQICALPVADLFETDCVCFMWATSPKLAEAMKVLEAWGLEYKTCMVWVKNKIGMGYYARQQHELLLIATRGNPPVPEPQDRPSSVINAPRGEHSAKPEEFYGLLDRMYPYSRRVELFARSKREGWDGWGNQA